MNIGILLPLILIVGVMFMMSRSAKNKQRQASEMRSKMEPGTGVRTIGGMYAVVKEVNDETVLLELTDGVHAHFAKNAIAVVLGEDEFNRIVHGIEPEEPEGLEHDGAEATDAAADDATPSEDADAAAKADTAEDAPIDLSKPEADAAAAPEQDASPARDAK